MELQLCSQFILYGCIGYTPLVWWMTIPERVFGIKVACGYNLFGAVSQSVHYLSNPNLYLDILDIDFLKSGILNFQMTNFSAVFISKHTHILLDRNLNASHIYPPSKKTILYHWLESLIFFNLKTLPFYKILNRKSPISPKLFLPKLPIIHSSSF